MPNFQHLGLYFTPHHIQTARQNRDRDVFQAAWQHLDDFVVDWGETEGESSITALIVSGFRYRFNEDAAAAEQAVNQLLRGDSLDPAAYPTVFDALANAVALAQAVELLRDHPALTPHLTAWLTRYAHFADQLQHLPDDATIVEQLWLGLLNLTSGLVLEAEDRFTAGVEAYQHAIQNEIRPEGYLPRATDGRDGGTFHRDFYAVAALVLMAEAASHAQLDLWSYTSRGISVNTAAAYLTYYYYYPDQWRWDEGVDAFAKDLFKSAGGFLELVNHHARPRDLKLLLDENRPFFNPILGGFTTLTHTLPPRKSLFG